MLRADVHSLDAHDDLRRELALDALAGVGVAPVPDAHIDDLAARLRTDGVADRFDVEAVKDAYVAANPAIVVVRGGFGGC